MKKKTARLTALFTALLSLTLSACGETTPSADPSASVGEDAAAPETVPEAEPAPADLFTVEKHDFGGATVSILTTETQKYEFDAEEYTGEGVNDAIYDRNAAVEDLLGVDLNPIYKPGDWANQDVFNNLIRASVMANDGAYDVTSGMVSCIMPIAGGELFRNLYDVPGMDFEHPWWVTEMPQNLTLNGKLYGMIGDVCLSMYKGLSVVFANTTILNNYGAEPIYDMVRSGSWTLDTLSLMAESYASDADGNGAFDADSDVAGLAIYEVTFRSMQASLDKQIIGVGEDGVPFVEPAQDSVATVIDSLTALLKSSFVPIKDAEEEMGKLFASQHAVFAMHKLAALDLFRDMENDYAILPFPKSDESQSRFYTLIPTASQILFVPITVTDTEKVGLTLEALCYYSFEGVIPQYYEVSLKTKLARDTDTREMLDIIREGAVLPFEYAYSTALAGDPWPNKVISDCAWHDRPYASAIASNTKLWEANIQSVMERYS